MAKVHTQMDDLQELGRRVVEQSNKFEEKCKEITSSLVELDQAWSGVDENTFSNNLKNYVGRLDEVKKALYEYGMYLQYSATAYSEIQDDFARRRID